MPLICSFFSSEKRRRWPRILRFDCAVWNVFPHHIAHAMNCRFRRVRSPQPMSAYLQGTSPRGGVRCSKCPLFNPLLRFIRYPSARPSSNRFVQFGRLCLNFIHGIVQIFSVFQYALTTLNNMLASLPFFVRYIVHGVLAVCFPFYSIYQGYLTLVNRIYRVAYPIYRAINFFASLVTTIVTLPVRIVTYVVSKTESFLKNLLVGAIVLGMGLGLVALFLDEYQSAYLKSSLRNATDILLKQFSMV